MPRYRFADFVLSPRQRMLVRDGRELPLIPRYFDLLVFLVERRGDAVHRRDIFDRVWADVIVSDSALSQAVRTLRRTLDDDPRAPRFIRTVARHGYQFVFPAVVEEADEGRWPAARGPRVEPAASDSPDAFEPLLARVCAAAASPGDEEEQREAAERLHALGTEAALLRLKDREGAARAWALLRDTRWDVAGAGAVPLLRAPSVPAAIAALARIRGGRAARIVTERWLAAAAGAGLAGAGAGVLGGLLLAVAPDGDAPFMVAPVLGLIGCACGALGGAGVGAGLSAAEAAVRSRRTLALLAGGALGGGLTGLLVQGLARATLVTLVARPVPVGGGLAGFVLGAAAGLGYAIATRHTEGGLAAPRGSARVAVATLTAVSTGLAALLLSLGGTPLVGGTIHAIAQASAGSQAMLTPLGRLVGEPDFGAITRALISSGEGALFGAGLVAGLTRRPAAVANDNSSRRSQQSLIGR